MAKKSAKKAAKQKRQAQNQARSRANKNATNDDSKQIKQMTAKMETISLGQDGKQTGQTLSLVPSGLGNQGNTCYFNSAMQILGQTYVLNRCLAERSDPEYRWKASTVYLEVVDGPKKEEDGCGEDDCGNLDARFKVDSRVMQLPDPHPLITAFVTLQRQIFTGSRTFPASLLGEIRKERFQFIGHSQQDAQELLISLLDSIKKFEADRQKKALPKALGIEDHHHPSPQERQLAQRFKIAANHTVVDAIFGGQLLSCIRCTECNHRSFTFEAFMDLSLSLNTRPPPANIADLTNQSTKFANNSAVRNSQPATANNNKGNKNKKNKKNGQVKEEVEADAEEEDENMPPLMDGGEEEEEEEDRHMTAKERKARRAAKKAAKRQARQVVREQAARDQGRSLADQGDLMVGQEDGGEEEIDDDDDDQNSTGAVDGGTSSPEPDCGLNVVNSADDATTRYWTSPGTDQDQGNFYLHEGLPSPPRLDPSGTFEAHQPMDLTSDADDHYDPQSYLQEQQLTLDEGDLPDLGDDSSPLIDGGESGHIEDAIFGIETWGAYDVPADTAMDTSAPEEGGVSDFNGADPTMGFLPTCWSQTPEHESPTVNMSFEGPPTQDEIDTALADILATEGEGHFDHTVTYGPHLPEDQHSSTADSGISFGDGTASETTTTASSTKSAVAFQSQEEDVFTSSDSMDASSSSNGRSSESKSPWAPSLLPHVDPLFRAKLYDLALQKVTYGGDGPANGDLGTLFEAFIKPETLDGVNKYLCDNCTAVKRKEACGGDVKVYSKAIRCQLIALPPAVLVVHLKRFEANAFGGGRGGGFTRGASYAHKLNTAITFPERLNLAPYTSKLYEMGYAKFYEQAAGDEGEGDGSQLEYRLYGVVLHSGGLRSGHYTAYVAVRPGQYAGPEQERLERFLHLKPFVANIEHIIGVCYDAEQEKVKKVVDVALKEENLPEDVKETFKQKETMEGKVNGDHNYHLENGLGGSSTQEGSNKSEPTDFRKWYHISDTSVSQTNLATVLRDTSSPYILFYERLQ